MSELDHKTIKTRSVQGMIALVQRTFILQIVGIVATLLLARFLGNETLGVFGVVNSIIAFLSYFSDIGLAGALIQKKEPLTQKDLVTTFTVQQSLVVAAVTIGLLLSTLLASFYKLDSAGLWLLRALMVSFFLSSLKTIPSIVLERKLDFQKLVIPQILETLGFNFIAVFLAWRGLGIWSFTWAALARGVIGLVAIYILAPWKISLGIDMTVAKRLFKFGIPFQSNSFLALLKDDLLFLFLGKLLPLGDMGFIFLAKKLAELPLRTVMDNVMRVTFPAFSRLQHDKIILKNAMEKTLFGISLIVFPLYVGMMAFIVPFMEIFPKYQKWEGAIVSFYFLCIASMIASLSSPMTNALNAIGKINSTLLLMIMWIVLTWFFVVLFVTSIGYNGFALALMTISSTIILVISLTQRYIPFSFINSIKIPLLGAFVEAGIYILLLPRISHTLPMLIVLGLGGLAVYGGIVWQLEKTRLNDLITVFRKK